MTRNKAKIGSGWERGSGRGGEGRTNRAQPLFLSSKVTPRGIQVPSRRPSPDHAGLRARRKADATGTTWVVDKERSWQPKGLWGTWVRSHKGRTSDSSPKSRPDHARTTINNVRSKVGGTERSSLEKADSHIQC